MTRLAALLWDPPLRGGGKLKSLPYGDGRRRGPCRPDIAWRRFRRDTAALLHGCEAAPGGAGKCDAPGGGKLESLPYGG